MNVNIKKNSKLFKLLFAFLIITFFFSGCLKIVRVTGVKINGGDKYLKIGETLQLSVTIEPSDATNTAVTWESSDSSKVTVNERGLVTAIAKLGAEITVITKDGKHEDTIAVYVGIANPNNPVNPGATCDSCNPCNPCNTCDPCNQCNPCNTCNPCNNCDPCNSYNQNNTCNPCNPCNTCNPCDPCNQNDPCNQCNTCQPEPCNPCDPSEGCYNPCECQSSTCNSCN